MRYDPSTVIHLVPSFFFIFRVQLQEVSHGRPTGTIQATPSQAMQIRQSRIAKPVVTKHEVGFQKKYNPYLYENPNAMPTTSVTTNSEVYANVPTGVDEYMHMESLPTNPPPLPHKKQGTPIADQEEIYDSIQ